jgi:protein-S-isoprenylcysteine O-methyltransferase Ste14
MAGIVYFVTAVIGSSLLAALVATLLLPELRIWPTPGEKTWQSYLFWPLFRSLNVFCFLVAAMAHAGALGIPPWLRIASGVGLALSIAIFLYAFRILGRDNSYGAREGLVTSGIYRWTRNPQNVMLMAVYGLLAFAADDLASYLACGAMVATYYLMILAEEPWLEGVYGSAYRDYCREVPRVFNWRLAASVLTGTRRG